MKVTFPIAKQVTIVKEKKQLLSNVNVIRVTDFPERKVVEAHVKEIGVIVLWKGAEYDAIGQWTDTDVINRIIQLYA